MSFFERVGPTVYGKLQPKLYDCQSDAIDSLIDWFQNPNKTNLTAVVVMPTGSGKTGVICSLPYAFGKSNDCLQIDLKKAILVIAPGMNILSQLESNFIPKKSSPSFVTKVGAIGLLELRDEHYKAEKVDDISELESNLNHIVLTNAQKWHNRPTEGPTWKDLPNDLFSIVIVDEAHHLPAEQWEQIVAKFRQHAKVIFFTATPYRTDGKQITTDNAINTQGYAYRYGDEEAVRERIIRPIEFLPLRFPRGVLYKYNPSDTRVHKGCINVVTESVISKIEAKDRDAPFPNGKKHTAILIARDIMEAGKVVQLCRADPRVQNDEVGTTHSNLSKQERQWFSKSLDEGKLRVIVIVSQLLEGFDYPPISVAGIVTRISSTLKFAQFVGRARRIVRFQGKVESDMVAADVITHEYFEQERVWERFLVRHLIPAHNNAGEDDD